MTLVDHLTNQTDFVKNIFTFSENNKYQVNELVCDFENNQTSNNVSSPHSSAQNLLHLLHLSRIRQSTFHSGLSKIKQKQNLFGFLMCSKLRNEITENLNCRT